MEGRPGKHLCSCSFRRATASACPLTVVPTKGLLSGRESGVLVAMLASVGDALATPVHLSLRVASGLWAKAAGPSCPAIPHGRATILSDGTGKPLRRHLLTDVLKRVWQRVQSVGEAHKARAKALLWHKMHRRSCHYPAN